MPTIDQLSATDTVSAGDLLPLFITSQGDARKASLSLLKDFFTSDDNADTAQTNVVTSYAINVPTDYPDISSALLALKNKNIPTDVTVTISVAAGQYTYVSPISFGHRDGARIKITGAAPKIVTLTGINPVTGSAGNWSVPLTVSDATNVTPGQVMIITAGVGTNWEAIAGAHVVTAVAGNIITLKIKNYVSAWPSVTITGGAARILSTVLNFIGSSGLNALGDTGLIDQIALVGDNTAGQAGVVTAFLGTEARSTVSVNFGANSAILNFETCALAQSCGAIHFIGGAAVSGGSIYGFHAQESGSIFANGCVSSGCGSHGTIAQYGGSVYMQGGLSIGNNGAGVLGQLNGSVLFKSSLAKYNQAVGGICGLYQGTVQAEFALASYNIIGVVSIGGCVYFGGASSLSNTGNGITSTANGTVHAQGATVNLNGANAVSVDTRGVIDGTSSVTTGTAFADRGGYIFLNGNTGTISGYTPSVNTIGTKGQLILNS